MQTLFSRMRKRLSLSVRVSFLLMLAALLPLVITIFSSQLLSRPLLISQANTAMETDIQAHIQTIENYFSQPIIDANLLSQNSFLSAYLTGNAGAAAQATNVLATGYQRNTNYITWSLIDAQGKQRLFYPVAAHAHGNYFIPPDTIKLLTASSNAQISSAFFDPQGNQLTVDITQAITIPSGNTLQVIGFLRATLNANFIWNMVREEGGVNGEGSYAFILDQNGVVIAHTDITQIFSVVAPFTPKMQQDISSLQRYGNTTIPVLANETLTNILKSANPQTSFQMVPQGHQESFSVVSRTLPVVPWTYFVLSPTSVVTALADQQLLTIGIIASIVLCLAAITGWLVGQRITAPVLHSVAQLQKSSQSLKKIAAEEQSTAAQQVWVVDASKTGLSSIHYYTSAVQTVISPMIEAGTGLEHRWPDVNPEKMQQALRWIVMTAHYIEEATQYQKKSSDKLSDTIELTKQVTEQLASGANAATNAAEQVEQVVSQLQEVVGQE